MYRRGLGADTSPDQSAVRRSVLEEFVNILPSFGKPCTVRTYAHQTSESNSPLAMMPTGFSPFAGRRAVDWRRTLRQSELE